MAKSETGIVYKKLPKELWAEGFETFTEADRYGDQYRDEYRFSIVNVPAGAWAITEPHHGPSAGSGTALPTLPTPRHRDVWRSDGICKAIQGEVSNGCRSR